MYKFKYMLLSTSYYYIVPKIISIIKELGLKSDTKILEVGCGKGELLDILGDLGFNNIWGFDISDSAIFFAKGNFPSIYDKLFQQDVYQSKLPDGIPQSHDLIIAMEIIEHLYSPEAFLDNAFNWLKKDGHLVITTPYHGYFKNLLIAITNKFDRHFNPLSNIPHFKFFSRRTLSILLEKKGFKVIKFKGAGGLMYLWKSMVLVAVKKQ